MFTRYCRKFETSYLNDESRNDLMEAQALATGSTDQVTPPLDDATAPDPMKAVEDFLADCDGEEQLETTQMLEVNVESDLKQRQTNKPNRKNQYIRNNLKHIESNCQID